MMLGWQAVAVNLMDFTDLHAPKLVHLSVVNYPLEPEREYAVSVAARGRSLTTYVDGALVNQVTGGELATGRVGLNVWRGKTLFRDLRFRLMATGG